MGHIIRCLALADELHDNHNCNIYFAIRRSKLGINKVESSYPVLTTNEHTFDYKKWLLECIRKSNAQILILDVRDGLPKRDLIKIKKLSGVRVVTIDDPEEKRLASDLAFYPPVPQLTATTWDGFNGRLYVGWEYVVLRQEFSRKYSPHKSIIPRILISMGGTDEKNMSLYVLGELEKIKGKFEAVILLGPGYVHKNTVDKYLDTVNYKHEVVCDSKNVAEIMSQVDFGIVSFGVSAYELASMSIPGIYICLTEDHLKSSMLFVQAEIGMSMGLYGQLKIGSLEKIITKFISDKQIIEDMSNRMNQMNISNINLIVEKILN